MKKRIIRIVLITIALGGLGFGAYQIVNFYSFAKEVQEDTPIFEEYLIESEAKNGDIIFQTSKSSQSVAIQLATHSKYSHVGIIYEINKQLFVYEAIQPVKLTPLNKWIKQGEGGHFVIKRLKNSDKILTKETLIKMKQVGEKYKGKNYDLYFEWSDDRMYCSELVWKIYKEGANIELGKLEELSDFDLTNKVVKQKLQERYGNTIPMHEKVISPAEIFNSDRLETVLKN